MQLTIRLITSRIIRSPPSCPLSSSASSVWASPVRPSAATPTRGPTTTPPGPPPHPPPSPPSLTSSVSSSPSTSPTFPALSGPRPVMDTSWTRSRSSNAPPTPTMGFVHRGLLKATIWVLNREAEMIARTLEECGDGYKLVFVGHSLGVDVVALMAVVAVNYLDRPRGIEYGEGLREAKFGEERV